MHDTANDVKSKINTAFGGHPLAAAFMNWIDSIEERLTSHKTDIENVEELVKDSKDTTTPLSTPSPTKPVITPKGP